MQRQALLEMTEWIRDACNMKSLKLRYITVRKRDGEQWRVFESLVIGDFTQKLVDWTHLSR